MLLLLFAGCAADTTLPPKTTTLTDLHPGADRTEVVARFGDPVSSKTDPNGKSVEVFKFVEGGPIMHPSPEDGAVLDAAATREKTASATIPQTGTINENTFKGDTLTVQVKYNEDNTVEDTALLQVTPDGKP